MGGLADGFDGLEGAADEKPADEEAEGNEGDADADEAVLEGGEFFFVRLE